MAVSDLHVALAAAHAEVLADPRHSAEGLDRAGCGPHSKHLAVLAAGAAAEGMSADRWRSDLLQQAGTDAKPALDAAEACMRASGLWPWNDETGPEARR